MGYFRNCKLYANAPEVAEIINFMTNVSAVNGIAYDMKFTSDIWTMAEILVMKNYLWEIVAMIEFTFWFH